MEGRALGVFRFAKKEESAEMRVILFELIRRRVTGANYHRRGAGSSSLEQLHLIFCDANRVLSLLSTRLILNIRVSIY